MIQVLSEILDSMTNITFKTTWSEAQQMLIDNPTFAEDTDLLSEFRFLFWPSCKFLVISNHVVTCLWCV